MDAEVRAILERNFSATACERIAAANRDYLNSHAEYLVPLVLLLNETRRERDEARAEVTALREALAAYRSALRCGEPETEQLRALGDAALAAVPAPALTDLERAAIEYVEAVGSDEMALHLNDPKHPAWQRRADAEQELLRLVRLAAPEEGAGRAE